VTTADASSFTFASIGDIHVKDNQPSSLREMSGEISKRASALVLCGDLTDTGTPSQAEILREELRACTIPVIGVLGNHDYESGHADQVERILCDGGRAPAGRPSC
jgi:predicted MPP superfamily phosphohydrolase